jgi:hypothetical protein
MHALEIAIASSSPGGGVSSNSPSFSSPNFCSQRMKQRVLEKEPCNEAESVIFWYFLVIILILFHEIS